MMLSIFICYKLSYLAMLF